MTVGNDGAERISTESRTYVAKYRDGAGIVRIVKTGCRDETAARGVLADLERRAELVKANVMTSGEDTAARQRGLAMELHLVAYFDSMGRGDCQ